MKTVSLLALLGLTAALAPVAIAEHDPFYCSWDRNVFQDQTVVYDGYTYAAVGVRFIDGSPCRVQVVCGGYVWGCRFPPLP